ncbi:MAG: NAD-dependent epimerase/dehydratase family protein [Steroidobacteraceae bacterium]
MDNHRSRASNGGDHAVFVFLSQQPDSPQDGRSVPVGACGVALTRPDDREEVALDVVKVPHILVTGGTGIYGRSLVRRLASEGHRVRILTRSDYGGAHPNVSVYRGGLESVGDLRQAMRGCVAVFHCAAEKYDHDKMASVNVAGTRNLVDLANELRVDFLCHLSSVGVTGRTRLEMVDESSACNPTSLYEETKWAAEEIVKCGVEAGCAVILRPTNIFAPATLGPLLADTVRSKIAAFLKGNEIAHFVYVEDAVAAALHCWRSTVKKRVDVFIVSSDEDAGGTFREIQAALASAIPSAPRPLWIAAPRLIPYWARRMRGNNANWGGIIYSSAKLRSAGFHFPYGLQAGIRHAAGELQNMAADR